MTTYTEHDSPLGRLLLAATDAGLAGIFFEQHRHFKGAAGWQRDDAHPLLRDAARQLDDYFAGRRRDFSLPLAAQGTGFQQRVWQALCDIPFGARLRYADLAQAVGLPGAARAVGAAVGRNPLSIVVPCHRVVGSNGSLTGYAGGLARKQALLALEGSAPA